MKYLILCLTILTISCKQEKQHTITIKLQDYAFNTLPLPDKTKMGDEVVKRDFELRENETSVMKPFDWLAVTNGKLDASFRYYPITIKKGTYKTNNTAFQVGLIDENRNNSFTDIGKDKLIFLPIGTDSIDYKPMTYSSVTTLDKKTIVQINGNKYNVKADNNEIILTQTDDTSDSVRCIFNSQIPDLQVFDEYGNERKLSDYKEVDKNLIIELWFMGCAGCIKALPKLKEINTDENTIISLNVVDSQTEIDYFKKKYDIPWDMVKSDKPALQQLGNLGRYPSAIVYDKQGNLVDFSKKF